MRLLDWTSGPSAAMYFACEFNTAEAPPKGRVKELNDLGVTRRTLFPDLDGLSAGLVTSHILRG
jgi:hypothetical protein